MPRSSLMFRETINLSEANIHLLTIFIIIPPTLQSEVPGATSLNLNIFTPIAQNYFL